jgi:tetratricopeptide (TPR) repeat protein
MDAMGDVDEEDLEACRDDELLNLHLLERTQQGVYELHQLLREYFRFQLQQHPEWQVLRQQVAVSLLNISKGIGQTITIDQVKEIAPAIPHLEILGRELLDHIPNPEDNLVWAFLGIARFYEGQSLYLSAINFYQNCLEAAKLKLGLDHLSVGISLNFLGRMYNIKGNFGQAEALLLQSLSIFKQNLPEHHEHIASCLNNLANYYQMQFRYSESEYYRLQSHRIILSVSGEDSELFAYSLSNLAQLYVAQEKFIEAEPIFLRAFVIIKQKFGDYDFRLNNILNNWAELYKIQQNYRNSEILFLRSLRICEQNLSPNHIDIAIGLNNLAECYRLQNKHMGKIRFLYLRAIEISEKVFGKDHRTTQIFRANMRLLQNQ